MATKKLYIPEIIYKETERKILWHLFDNGDTYFADYFSEEDVHKMAENINNDFPLLMNTSIDRKYEQCKANSGLMANELTQKNAQLETRANTINELDAIVQANRKKVEKMAVALLRQDPTSEIVYELMDPLEVIGLKIRQRIDMVYRDDEYFGRNVQKQ